jgi:hypothetical protein
VSNLEFEQYLHDFLSKVLVVSLHSFLVVLIYGVLHLHVRKYFNSQANP